MAQPPPQPPGQMDALVQALAALTAQMAQAQQAPVVAIPQGLSVKLKAFSSCDPDEWLTWRQRFELEMQCKGWNNQLAKVQLKGSMEGNAARLVSDIDPDNPNLDIQQMLTNYETKFVPAAQQANARNMFRNAQRKQGEELGLYHARVMALARRAFPNINTETDVNVLDKFRAGLNDPELQEYLELQDPQTMTNALDVARRKDNATGNRVKAEKGIKTEPGVYALQEALQLLGEVAPLTRAKRIETYGRQAADRRPATAMGKLGPRLPTHRDLCFNCFQRGHFRKHCPRPQTGAWVPRPRSAMNSRRPPSAMRRRPRRRRLLFARPGGKLRMLKRRPGRFGRWKRVNIPRRRKFRRFTRGKPFRPFGVYAIDDEEPDEYDEMCHVEGEAETEDYYYLDVDDDDESYVAAMADALEMSDGEFEDDEAADTEVANIMAPSNSENPSG